MALRTRRGYVRVIGSHRPTNYNRKSLGTPAMGDGCSRMIIAVPMAESSAEVESPGLSAGRRLPNFNGRPEQHAANTSALSDSAAPRLMDQPPKRRRGNRKITRFNTKRRQCVRYGIANDSSHRRDRILARSLYAERIACRSCEIQSDRANIQEIRCDWQQIVGERAGKKLRAIVVHQVFKKHAS